MTWLAPAKAAPYIEVGGHATLSGDEVEVVLAKSRIDLGNVARNLIGEVIGGLSEQEPSAPRSGGQVEWVAP
ncbi:hypothetical protein [Gordonia otitidis]|mgnify:FL=1|uniref:hypothetical protein n=1 Tax=Gordonia otitidis TaxID=249058 RepID=UPI0023546F1D|nr:hypothetical protein [Gordonia otitidis]